MPVLAETEKNGCMATVAQSWIGDTVTIRGHSAAPLVFGIAEVIGKQIFARDPFAMSTQAELEQTSLDLQVRQGEPRQTATLKRATRLLRIVYLFKQRPTSWQQN